MDITRSWMLHIKKKSKFPTHYYTMYIKMTDERVYKGQKNIINGFFDSQKALHRVLEAINFRTLENKGIPNGYIEIN